VSENDAEYINPLCGWNAELCHIEADCFKGLKTFITFNGIGVHVRST
jgi:hypothetical protein